jgi:hypothetical protein
MDLVVAARKSSGDEDRERRVRIDRQLPDDRGERGHDAAQDHDDGHGQPHPAGQRAEEHPGRRQQEPTRYIGSPFSAACRSLL